jgi:hypothetical protein
MSNRKVKTPDTGYIVALTTDGYGDGAIVSENEIACAFFQHFTQEQVTNVNLTQASAYAYLDVDNVYIQSLGYELEGLYFKIAPFGVDQWYRIEDVDVAVRKLLTNEVNNVLVNLQVVAAPQVVS